MPKVSPVDNESGVKKIDQNSDTPRTLKLPPLTRINNAEFRISNKVINRAESRISEGTESRISENPSNNTGISESSSNNTGISAFPLNNTRISAFPSNNTTKTKDNFEQDITKEQNPGNVTNNQNREEENEASIEASIIKCFVASDNSETDQEEENESSDECFVVLDDSDSDIIEERYVTNQEQTEASVKECFIDSDNSERDITEAKDNSDPLDHSNDVLLIGGDLLITRTAGEFEASEEPKILTAQSPPPPAPYSLTIKTISYRCRILQEHSRICACRTPRLHEYLTSKHRCSQDCVPSTQAIEVYHVLTQPPANVLSLENPSSKPVHLSEQPENPQATSIISLESLSSKPVHLSEQPQNLPVANILSLSSKPVHLSKQTEIPQAAGIISLESLLKPTHTPENPPVANILSLESLSSKPVNLSEQPNPTVSILSLGSFSTKPISLSTKPVSKIINTEINTEKQTVSISPVTPKNIKLKTSEKIIKLKKVAMTGRARGRARKMSSRRKINSETIASPGRNNLRRGVGRLKARNNREREINERNVEINERNEVGPIQRYTPIEEPESELLGEGDCVLPNTKNIFEGIEYIVLDDSTLNLNAGQALNEGQGILSAGQGIAGQVLNIGQGISETETPIISDTKRSEKIRSRKSELKSKINIIYEDIDANDDKIPSKNDEIMRISETENQTSEAKLVKRSERSKSSIDKPKSRRSEIYMDQEESEASQTKQIEASKASGTNLKTSGVTSEIGTRSSTRLKKQQEKQTTEKIEPGIESASSLAIICTNHTPSIKDIFGDISIKEEPLENIKEDMTIEDFNREFCMTKEVKNIDTVKMDTVKNFDMVKTDEQIIIPEKIIPKNAIKTEDDFGLFAQLIKEENAIHMNDASLDSDDSLGPLQIDEERVDERLEVRGDARDTAKNTPVLAELIPSVNIISPFKIKILLPKNIIEASGSSNRGESILVPKNIIETKNIIEAKNITETRGLKTRVLPPLTRISDLKKIDMRKGDNLGDKMKANNKVSPNFQGGDNKVIQNTVSPSFQSSSSTGDNIGDNSGDNLAPPKFPGTIQSLTCKYCHTTLADTQALAQHFEDHMKDGLIICYFCQKSFGDKTGMKRHMRVHTGEKPYQCKVCGKRFSLPGNFKKHRDIHEDRRTEPCNICGKTFRRKEHLKYHMRTHTGEKPYSCGECGTSFTARYSLQIHMNIHLGKKPYKCSYCSKAFSDKSTMRKHVRVHTGEKPFKCLECRRCFGESGTLAAHMATHRNDRPFKCEKCELSFKTTGGLRQHEKVHSGEKQFACNYCGMKFLQKYNKTMHERIHTGEKPYSCSHCDRSFRSRSCLAKHVVLHGGEDERRFGCDHCTSRFYRKAHLRRHIDMHLGIKNFECPKCSKKFCTRGTLRSHVKTFHSHGARRFPCNWCGRVFKRRVYVSTHVCNKDVNIKTEDGIEAEGDEGETSGMNQSETRRTNRDMRQIDGINQPGTSLASLDPQYDDSDSDSDSSIDIKSEPESITVEDNIEDNIDDFDDMDDDDDIDIEEETFEEEFVS